jgi:hypothetical protein
LPANEVRLKRFLTIDWTITGVSFNRFSADTLYVGVSVELRRNGFDSSDAET